MCDEIQLTESEITELLINSETLTVNGALYYLELNYKNQYDKPLAKRLVKAYIKSIRAYLKI